eukprot:7702697-Karenia_brevis.AAC.1
MIPHSSESEIAPQADTKAPEGARYLQAALEHPHYAGNVTKLMNEVDEDLALLGLTWDRRTTFRCR